MKKLTLPAIGGLLLSSLLLPSALAANLPKAPSSVAALPGRATTVLLWEMEVLHLV